MSSITVAEFANELKKTPEVLLDQLKAAGVAKAAPTDALTEADKQKLLAHLRPTGAAAGDRKKITMVKKSTSEIKQADASGKARTIQVEVRKKRTFIQRDETVKAPAAEPAVSSAAAAAAPAVAPAVPVVATPENKELARREEAALGQADSIRRQEEELSETRQARQALEQREREAAERASAYAAQEAQKKAQASAAKKEASREYAEENAARIAAQAAAREKAEAESKARAEEEAARAVDLSDRRRKAEAEAAAIRSMMSAPPRCWSLKSPKNPSQCPVPPMPKKARYTSQWWLRVLAPQVRPALRLPAQVQVQAKKSNRPSCPLAGRVIRPRKRAFPPVAMPVEPIVAVALLGAVDRVVVAAIAVAMTAAIAMPTTATPHRWRRARWKSTCPRPSPCPSWRTRCRSRRLRSSRR